MKLTYDVLKEAAAKGDKLGNWKGKPVFATSFENLKNLGSGAYYVVYNDDNAFVKCEGEWWYEYGYLEESGAVREIGRRPYTVSVKKEEEKKKKEEEFVAATAAENSYTPGYDVEERPVGDVKVEINVEEVLKNAREMTVADLLEGFELNV